MLSENKLEDSIHWEFGATVAGIQFKASMIDCGTRTYILKKLLTKC